MFSTVNTSKAIVAKTKIELVAAICYAVTRKRRVGIDNVFFIGRIKIFHGVYTTGYFD